MASPGSASGTNVNDKPGGETAPAAPASTQEDGPKVDFNDVFSLRKPKDFKAGLSSGLKSLAKGVVAGAATLVCAPVVGATQGGVVGFGKGVVTGVVGAVVLPVTGATVGVVQVVRGAANVPEALAAEGKGKIWDEERREWIDKPDGALITAEAAKDSTKFFKKPASGVDYYAILEVPRDATPEAIKKAYYMMARKWHPDKNPGDASAHERFQLLGEAYQVLGNAELRERYDQYGSEALDVNFMDSGEFFNMLFGNDMFEHLIGELAIAMAAKSAGQLSQGEMKRQQLVRIEKLAVNLRNMIKRYEAGDIDGFKHAMTEEALHLAGASFGETLLHAIGKVYEQQADIHLGGFFGGFAAKMKASGESMRSQINAASAAIKVFQAQQKLEAWQKEKEKEREKLAAPDAAAPAVKGQEAAAAATPSGQQQPAAAASTSGAQQAADGSKPAAGEGAAAGASDSKADGAAGEEAGAAPRALTPEEEAERRQMEEATLPLMLEAMWAANVLDIQATLKKVCERLLEEKGVPSIDLRTRALAIRELGIIFQGARAPVAASGSEQQDAKRQMEEAMMRVMEKRTGMAQERE